MPHTENLIRQLEEANRLIADQKEALDQAAIVAVTNAKGVISYVNEMFCDISGYSFNELVGQTHGLVNSGFHPASFFSDMWKTISQGKVWKADICNRGKDGSIYWVDTVIVPFLNSEGKPYQYIAVRYDITHKKQTEASLLKERERLFVSEKMASLGILSTGISHELGNPLGALRGRLEMLEMLAERGENITPDQLSAAVEKMIGMVDRMAKIIRGLRSYARDGSKDPYESVNMADLISDILEISKDRCRKHGVTIRPVGLNQSVMAFGREAELGQVIVNILNNAVDAAKGGQEKWVGVSLGVQGEKVQLRISDSGSGIPENLASKIFDPFFTTKGVGEGTGLGLSICKSIVENHKGSIEILAGHPNTCFEILIPQP